MSISISKFCGLLNAVLVVLAVLVSSIWVVTGSVVWVVVVSVIPSTVGNSEVHVINEASLLLKMVVVRVNITISVENWIGEHVGLEHILVFHQVLALMGEHVSILGLEVMAQCNSGLWCIVGVTSNIKLGTSFNMGCS